MAKNFHLALGLWIRPDFSEVTPGIKPKPRVDHNEVDFQQLRTILKSTFRSGPAVEILVPNDTVDQVTAHTRMGMVPGFKAAATDHLRACHDFGDAMLALAGKAVDGCIDVRSAWNNLHSEHIRDRSFAPPPSLLPFMVVAKDFEDAMFWMINTRPILGLKPFNPMEAFEPEPKSPDSEAGTMPDELKAGLREIFGCPFHPYPVLLSRLAMDKIPY